MKNLKLLRKSNGLSLKELGKIIGVAESTVSLYENEKRQPDFNTLNKLANYFNVTVDYLLGREEKPVTKRDEPNIRENVVIFNRNGKIIKKEFTEEEMNIISTMLESLKGAQNEDL